MAQKARLSTVIEKLSLKNYTPEIDLKERFVNKMDINRPALQLYGFYEHFDPQRVQIIGMVEWAFLFNQLEEEERHRRYEKLLSYDIPCIIICRDLQPEKAFLDFAKKSNIPVLGTYLNTTDCMEEVISCLKYELAPVASIHGVLVDVYGEGVLIMGESGIGKSEAALELVRRGHRLVADDVVEIRRINNGLVGKPPEVLKHFIELRGVGIIDVKNLFGVECIKLEMNVDFVIKLEEWNQATEYDRMGLKENHTQILGVNLASYNIPIRPGRNLAVICETAAANYRQKEMGYNAAKELSRRVQDNMNRIEE